MIIPTWNRSAQVVGAVRSVLAQTDADLEVVVVDDGSTDDTAEVLAAVGDPRVMVVRQANAGISSARNAGAAAASGRWLAMLDDDDRMRPGYLEAMRVGFERDGAAVVTCGAELRSATGTTIGTRLPTTGGPAFDGVRAWFTSGTMAVEREAMLAVGGYLEGLQCSHQTELAFRLLDWCRVNGRSVAAVDAVLVDLIRQAPEDRPEASPAKLLSGTEAVLARHPERFARDAALRADFHAIAGVAASRLGRRPEARRHLRAAALATPSDPRQLARLAIACVPPLADRVWGRDRFT